MQSFILLKGGGTMANKKKKKVARNIRGMSVALESATKSVDLFKSTIEEVISMELEVDNNTDKGAMDFADIYDMLGGFETVKGIASTFNEVSQSNAKLKLIVDVGDDGSVEELRKKIFSSAQDSRVAYTDMVSSVTKLKLSANDLFNNDTDEIIKFSNIVQKMGALSGISAPDMLGVTDQINQTMISGQLQGEDYDSIMGNMPILEQTLINFTGLSADHLRELAYQGKFTSDIIKSAMFSVASEVDERFKDLPITFEQIWDNAISSILMLSQPILEFISLLAENWSILEPIILGIAAIWGVYSIAVGKAKIVQAAQAVWTKITTVAQNGLNAALLACPLVWIIMIIIALVAVFYAVIAAINKFAGTTYSATGFIAAIFVAAGAFIVNIFILAINIVIGLFIQLYNLIAIIANFFATAFNNPVATIIDLFVSLFDVILGIVQKAANLIDTVLGTNISENIKNFRNLIATSTGDIIGENKVEVLKKIDEKDYQIQYLDYGNAWDAGYKFGEGIDGKITDSFKFDDLNKKDIGLNTDDLGNVLDDQEYDVNVKDEVNLADESLKYLLDEVTQKYINNINLQAPAPNVSVQIDVENGSDLDLDAIAEKTKQKLGVEIVEFAMSSTDIRR